MAENSNGLSHIDPQVLAAVAALMEGNKGRKKSTPEEKAARMAANDAKCIEVFTKAGYKEVRPRVNVLTYKGWLEKGRMVRKSEKSHRVGPFNLFHVDQTDPIIAEAKDKPNG